MKLSEAKTIEEIAIAVEEKVAKQGYYLLRYEQHHQFLIFHVACPTDKFIKAKEKSKIGIKITPKTLKLKDMFIIDYLKVDLCKLIEPRKSEQVKHSTNRKKIMHEITK